MQGGALFSNLLHSSDQRSADLLCSCSLGESSGGGAVVTPCIPPIFGPVRGLSGGPSRDPGQHPFRQEARCSGLCLRIVIVPYPG